MQRWEYKFVFNLDENMANSLGDQGWELVTVYFIEGGLGVHASTCFYFKRPK